MINLIKKYLFHGIGKKIFVLTHPVRFSMSSMEKTGSCPTLLDNWSSFSWSNRATSSGDCISLDKNHLGFRMLCSSFANWLFPSGPLRLPCAIKSWKLTIILKWFNIQVLFHSIHFEHTLCNCLISVCNLHSVVYLFHAEPITRNLFLSLVLLVGLLVE